MLKYTDAKINYLEGLLMSKVPHSKYWIIQDDFFFCLDYENKDGKILIEKGFITDFGSIPRFMWWFLNPTEFVSYIIHDSLYSEDFEGIQIEDINNYKWLRIDRMEVNESGIFIYPSRRGCDKILDMCLEVEKMSKFKRFLVNVGLLIGGGFCFKK